MKPMTPIQLARRQRKARKTIQGNAIAAVSIALVAHAAFAWALTGAIRPINEVAESASRVNLMALAEHSKRLTLNLGQLPALIVYGHRG